VHLRAFVAQSFTTCTISTARYTQSVFEQCSNEIKLKLTDNVAIGKSNIRKTHLRTEIVEIKEDRKKLAKRLRTFRNKRPFRRLCPSTSILFFEVSFGKSTVDDMGVHRTNLRDQYVENE
jgi:hypothetical protein